MWVVAMDGTLLNLDKMSEIALEDGFCSIICRDSYEDADGYRIADFDNKEDCASTYRSMIMALHEGRNLFTIPGER